MKDELIGLIRDAGEHVAYLSELGVTDFDDASASTGVAKAGKPNETRLSPGENSTLRRNAEAALKASVPAASETSSRASSARPPIAQPVSGVSSRANTRLPKPSQSGPRETLFGEVAPATESGLPCNTESLEDIWNDIGDCTRCPLAAGRTHIVNSHGNRNARLMFVGEAPGADEDAQARPFVGRAGQLLTKIIEAIGIKREEVLIGNVNRCRPPQNRPPTPEEAKTCKPFILREIAVVKPDVIVVLGNTAMKNLLDAKEGITKLRGQFQDYHGIKVMPTFHPAYLLRDPSKKREAWEDMKMVRAYLDSIANEK
ncbi:MAG: uracil-DNA glycosylase [Acidobacteriota bacterium]|nr:uracil-DNA glycosylase [Acidobacteriota bacterium]